MTVARVTEVTSSSTVSFEDAIKQAPGAGKNQYTECLVYNIHEAPLEPAPLAPKGNARARAVLKLRTEAERPDARPAGHQLGAVVGTRAPPGSRFHRRGENTLITWIGSLRRLSRAHGAQ